jgi:hypothetical protein
MGSIDGAHARPPIALQSLAGEEVGLAPSSLPPLPRSSHLVSAPEAARLDLPQAAWTEGPVLPPGQPLWTTCGAAAGTPQDRRLGGGASGAVVPTFSLRLISPGCYMPFDSFMHSSFQIGFCKFLL